MSTICLAAQRSYTTGEAVWFSYRLPSMKRVLGGLLASIVCLCAMVVAGLYAHLYHDLRHPAPAPKPAAVAAPETQVSDMHYVYVSKPFPQPKPKPELMAPLPAPEESPIMDNEADWQQAPDGVPQDLPDTHNDVHNDVHTPSLQERFMQAVKEQQLDYSQGKIPPQPEDEALNSEQEVKKSPPGLTEGDERREFQ